MTRISSKFFLAIMSGAIGLSAWALPAPAIAQAAGVETCAVAGYVKLTILGVPSIFNLPCINKTEEHEHGVDDNALVGTTTWGIPALASVVSVTAPDGMSSWVKDGIYEKYAGETEVSDLIMLGGAIQLSDVVGGFGCKDPGNSAVVDCLGFTQIGQLIVGGQSISLPPQIPFDYPVAVTNLIVPIAGLGNFSLSGQITLNATETSDLGTPLASIEAIPVKVSLSGQLLGLASLTIEIKDDTFLLPAREVIYMEEINRVVVSRLAWETAFPQQ